MSSLSTMKHRLQSLLGTGQRRLPAPDYRGFPHKHLLGIDALDASEIRRILDCAEHYITRNQQQDKKYPILKGRTLINLFFENSTRTRTSFEIAGKRLNMDVINISVAASSVAKGETLLDTARSLDAMNADAIVVRHGESGVAHMLARTVRGCVINGGDGAHEHPTQALLDALTIRQHKGTLEGLRVAICGDILHSRVARSNIILLKKMGAIPVMVAPSTLLPAAPASFGVEHYTTMEEGLKNADVVMMLRVQTERMEGRFVPSVREYFARYGLDTTKLAIAKPDALVMHPGPINRGVEIDGTLADTIERCVILQQVEMGVAVRQAVLELLLGAS